MRTLMLLVGLAGCEPMPATGDPLAPVPQRSRAPADAVPAAAEPAPGTPDPVFDEAPVDDGSDDEPIPDDPVALLAMQQGLEAPPPEPEPEPELEPAPPAPVPQAAPPPVELPAWDPATAPPTSWGVRLLATMNSTNPPRAVIGLPDGTERVVQAGAMLPEQQLVVMAIGRQQVEVAHIVPSGYQAQVRTQTISALFPTD